MKLSKLKYLDWIGFALTMLGIYLNANKIIYCWPIWLGSNVFWTAHFAPKKELAAIQDQVKMGLATVDKQLCHSYNGASCGICVRACPFEGKALRAGMWEKPIVDPDYCVGCGLCERACVRYPQAIHVTPLGVFGEIT